jgi:ribosome-associated heat shock protein Hsp15
MARSAVPISAAPMSVGGALRIDKLLWYLRLAPNRSQAQALAARGIIRLNGRRVEKAHVPVHTGDIITLPYRGKIATLRVLMLPTRRGGAPEAEGHYERLFLDPKRSFIDEARPTP